MVVVPFPPIIMLLPNISDLNINYVEIQVIYLTIKLDINAYKLNKCSFITNVKSFDRKYGPKIALLVRNCTTKRENPSWWELHHQRRKSLMSVMPSCNCTWWWCCFSIELILYNLALWNRMMATGFLVQRKKSFITK